MKVLGHFGGVCSNIAHQKYPKHNPTHPALNKINPSVISLSTTCALCDTYSMIATCPKLAK